MNGFPSPVTHQVGTTDRPASADITVCFSRLEPKLYLEVLNVQGGVCLLSLVPREKNQPFSFSLRQEEVQLLLKQSRKLHGQPKGNALHLHGNFSKVLKAQE